MVDGIVGKWGAIWKVIPTSEKDTRDAVETYAFGLNTASVFHCMRVSEFGLRWIAQKLRVKITDKGKVVPIEFGTWEKVII